MQLDMTTLAWTAWTTGWPELLLDVFSPQGPEMHLDVPGKQESLRFLTISPFLYNRNYITNVNKKMPLLNKGNFVYIIL
jgi:hypothetical protein